MRQARRMSGSIRDSAWHVGDASWFVHAMYWGKRDLFGTGMSPYWMPTNVSAAASVSIYAIATH